jgi:hypothetical protein
MFGSGASVGALEMFYFILAGAAGAMTPLVVYY